MKEPIYSVEGNKFCDLEFSYSITDIVYETDYDASSWINPSDYKENVKLSCSVKFKDIKDEHEIEIRIFPEKHILNSIKDEQNDVIELYKIISLYDYYIDYEIYEYYQKLKKDE